MPGPPQGRRKPTLLPETQLWLPWSLGIPSALGAESPIPNRLSLGFLRDKVCRPQRPLTPRPPALQMAWVTMGWALGTQGHLPEPGVASLFPISHLSFPISPFLCAPCLLERQALLWVSGLLKGRPGGGRGKGGRNRFGERSSSGLDELPRCKNRDVLPPDQQPQALMRHLCLGKGNLVRDMKTTALFGSPSVSPSPVDTVGLVATGSHLGMRWPGSARGTTSAPQWLQAATLTGWRPGPEEEKNGALSLQSPKGTFGFKHSKGWRGQRSTV